MTLQVPLDHFDAANTETIDVVFGVLPAFGERYGMYVQAFPGGPGGEGISSAYTGYFSEGILEHYDIVYYDQRGIGLSNPLECPVTYEADFLSYLTETDDAGEEGYDTPEEQTTLVDDTRTYIEDCVAEIGIDPAKLAFFGTDQVAEDIESFRATIGDEKFWMYGVSYGTAVAQTYAYAHPDRLAGLVLDGTINMTLKGEEGVHGQEVAFEKVLLEVLNACNKDTACAADMGGKDAVAVYDDLATELADKPIDYEFPLASGETVNGKFTFNQLEYTTSYQMYSLAGRMIFLKALAAAQQGDIIPMMRMMYQNASIDPAAFDYLGDSTFSDTMFLGVFCTDDQFFSGTPEERIAQSIEAGQASNGTVPRLDGSLYVGVSCAFWPASPTEAPKREPLVLEGVPTFVLNATLDPATPFEEGKFVADNLANGYHIYVEGGVHSIYGWGNECPDNYISDFLVDGTLPSQREIVCTDWETEPYSFYIPNLPKKASDFDSLIDMMIALEDNFYYMPEVYFGDWEEEDTIGCTYGGTYSFGPGSDGSDYKYNECSMMPGVVITGTSTYNSGIYLFNSTLAISGEKEGNLSYVYNYQTQTATLTGEYDGESINLTK
ncbi:MAG: alpha/beta fold hydrolase [Lewinellaceae bacterium]|nr:alpha/beta fold hydrolase [Lewinellaceae bacterium]